MSILYSALGVLRDVASLFLPRTCIACGDALRDNERGICLVCRYNAPLTDYATQAENPIKLVFENLFSVEQATAMFWFELGSDWRTIVYNFKYHNRWLFAVQMGEWFGEELKMGGLYDDVDVILPVPLHYRRRMKRGYNQSELLAVGMARKMGIGYDFRSLKRVRCNESQTNKSRTERWANVDDLFEVRGAERLRGRHILLVDDVLTTGATINACAEAIIRACEGDVRISVATLAASTRWRPGV